MVGPVGVDHLDLGDGGIAPLLGEIALAEREVGPVHRQPALGQKRRQPRLVQIEEAFKHLHVGGHGLLHPQRRSRLKRCLAGLDRVDDVALDGGHVLVGKRALQHVHGGAAHLGTRALADQLNAFARAVGALIELAGKVLHREHDPAARVGHLQRGHVGLRLAEHRGHAAREQLFRDALHVVAVQQTQSRKPLDAHDVAQLVRQRLGRAVETGLLLHVDTRNHDPALLLRLATCWNPSHRPCQPHGHRQTRRPHRPCRHRPSHLRTPPFRPSTT